MLANFAAFVYDRGSSVRLTFLFADKHRAKKQRAPFNWYQVRAPLFTVNNLITEQYSTAQQRQKLAHAWMCVGRERTIFPHSLHVAHTCPDARTQPQLPMPGQLLLLLFIHSGRWLDASRQFSWLTVTGLAGATAIRKAADSPFCHHQRPACDFCTAVHSTEFVSHCAHGHCRRTVSVGSAKSGSPAATHANEMPYVYTYICRTISPFFGRSHNFQSRAPRARIKKSFTFNNDFLIE